jgi:C-terminal processing protease CtpA/Prc
MAVIKLKSVTMAGWLIFSGNLLVSGCSLLGDLWQQDEIAEYGETVFRKQNLLTSQVMMLSESELSEQNQQRLQQAEARMQEDCKLLNEYATREMDAENIDLLFRKQVKDSIKGCDMSIQKMEATLLELGIQE